MQKHAFRLTFGLALTWAMTSVLAAQTGDQPPPARQELQAIHTPRSMDQELDRLTKDLQLTPEQVKKVRPLLQEHHDKIQALLDKNPTASRQALATQIHAISAETHREIHALLTDPQKELEKAMVQREHGGLENRRFSSPPASASASAPWSPRSRDRDASDESAA